MSSPGSAERLILRGGVSAGLGFLARFGARFLFLFIAGQLYGQRLFGAFAVAVAIAELGVAAGGVGLRKILFQLLDRNAEVDERPALHVVLDGALLVSAASGALAAVVVGGVLLLPAGTIGTNTATALLIVAPMITGQALLDLLTAATRWKHVMQYEVMSRSFIEPYAGLAAAAAAYLLGFQQTGLAISYGVGTLAALAFSVLGLRRTYGRSAVPYRTSVARLAATLRSTTANTTSDFVNAVFTRLDLYLVGGLLGEAAAGIYGMARQLRTPVRQVRQSLESLLTPIAARTLSASGAAQAGAALASASRLILAMTLPVLVVLFALGEPLLAAFGAPFVAGYRAMLIVTAAEIIQGAYGLSSLILVYRAPWIGLRLTVLWALIGFLAGAAAIPLAGIEAAAASVLLAYGGMALHRRLLLGRRFAVVVPVGHSLGPLVAAAAALTVSAVTAMLLRPMSELTVSFIAAAAGLAVYASALWAAVRLTGERLTMAGFVAEPPPQRSAQ